MHRRAQAHSCNGRVLYVDKSRRPEIPSLPMGSHLLSGGQKAGTARQALLLLAVVTTAKSPRRGNLWTDDEAWII
jgi:hypothetical protein